MSYLTQNQRLAPMILVLMLATANLLQACRGSHQDTTVDGNKMKLTQSPSTKPQRGHNRLKAEKSPYLLQHSDNPVDWYPWGEEAFAKAHAEDKPVFLSIGYSTCHWCHVMERESFEDTEVAQLLNEAFVCIKVDREERPDLDDIYMAACQAMTGSGGWPLTVILTPDRKPFFAGTYFPKESRFGRIGMLELIPRISQIWTAQRAEALQSAEQLTDMLQSSTALPRVESGSGIRPEALDSAYQEFARQFDERHGGFGEAPKFPAAHNLLFLLRYGKLRGSSQALSMVEKTLRAMRQGGIFDHLGFGFHRYSTDARWLTPHFEKMLYDQAMLAMVYAEAYIATGRSELGQTTREVIDYILQYMQGPEGGFCSAEDADSDGEEGKFYVWREEEIRRVLNQEEAEIFIRIYNVESGGNFVDPLSGHLSGDNILHLRRSWADLAGDFHMPEAALAEVLTGARRKLLAQRDQRVRPYRDDKILTDWNGLMIAALAKAAQALDEPLYARAATQGADFILQRLRGQDGRLLHRYRDKEAAIPANLDDYAFMIWGLIELYEATFNVRYFQSALDLQQKLLAHFWDTQEGGFFFTADDAEDLLVRRKEVYDGALPSGNSVALLNLLRLGRMTANQELEERAVSMGRAFAATVARYPAGYTMMLLAADFALQPSQEVVIAGDLKKPDTQAMIKALRGLYIPNKVVLHRPEGENPEITSLSPWMQPQTSLQGKATAYVCRNFACQLPTTDIIEMEKLMKRID